MNIPSGNVTFLFTDIEGSTKLSQEYPDTLPKAIERQHSILQNAIESNNGFVFEIVGDAFCGAFEKAEDAVKAAVDAQLNLGAEKWEDAVIKVRIGIHSGNAEWNGNRYMGYITLARSARVMSAAYGEQIIISNTTYELTKNEFYAFKEKDISFRDLGERRLKDVIQPIRLFQILCPGLRDDFPPLKTLDARPNNLPIQLSSFIGREEVMKEIKKLFVQTRLLTILGSGGSGKTRLAMQVGADMIDDFPNGVFIVELAPVNDAALIVQTVMNSLKEKELPGHSLDKTLIDYLNDKEMLIVLDNCEHLINESAALAEMLLRKCPKLKIISTSRESLNCSGEFTFRLPSMSLPDVSVNNTAEKLSQYESVRLFIERALSVSPNFRVNNDNAPALAEICRRLDGIPLAIELAAARTKVLSLEKIHQRLDDRFNLLSRGIRTALPRQQTLRALIDWSYDLLLENEKKLWNRLSVFNGGWTLEAAEEICSDDNILKPDILDLLSQLAEKSIIIYDEVNSRYKILETIKQYGEEKLKDVKETEAMLAKHLDYYLLLSETTELKLKGTESEISLERLESDHDNFQAAITCSLSRGDYEKGARLSGALGRFWKIRGHYSIGRKLLESILDNSGGIRKSTLRKALTWNGILSHDQGEYEHAMIFYNRSLELCRELNDKNGIASTLNSLGSLVTDQGNYKQAKKYYDESLTLRREIGDEFNTARSLNNLGGIEYELGNFEQAKKYYNESLVLKRATGDYFSIAEALGNLGNISYAEGDFEQSQKFHEECLSLSRSIGHKYGNAWSLVNIGKIKFVRGEYDNAQKFFEEALAIQHEIGDKIGISYSLNELGNLYLHKKNDEQALKLFEESITLFRQMGYRLGIAITLDNMGRLAFNKADYANARKFIEESLALSREIGDKWGIALTLNRLGNLAYHDRNYDQAKKFYLESIELKHTMSDSRGIAFSLIGIAGVLAALNHLSRSAILLGAAEIFLKSIGSVLEINEQKIRAEIINNIHEKLSDEEFEKYSEEGKRLTLDEAISMVNGEW